MNNKIELANGKFLCRICFNMHDTMRKLNKCEKKCFIEQVKLLKNIRDEQFYGMMEMIDE